VISELRDFLKRVEEYQSNYRNPAMGPLEVSPPYDHFPELGEPALQCGQKWPGPWFHLHRAGVYGFFDESLRLVYIGKASFRSSQSARLGSYVRYGPDGCCELKHEWNSKPRYAVTVAVPQSSRFEAAALEEFLLSKLTTTDNAVGARPQGASEGMNA
jgi:hypothetical protein